MQASSTQSSSISFSEESHQGMQFFEKEDLTKLTNLRAVEEIKTLSFYSFDHINYLIPPEIQNYSNLRALKIHVNNSQLPNEVRKLENLRSLQIYANNFDLKKSFGQLTQLKKLVISADEIEHFPKEITNLGQLNYLVCLGLKAIYPELYYLTNLENLQLKGNGDIVLKKFPKQNFYLTKLKTLKISKMQIQSIKLDLFNLIRLESLCLNVKLIEIPREIKFLKQLSVLDLSSNLLKNIPKELFKLRSLTILSFSNNKLRFIQKQIGKLTNIRELYLFNNPLAGLPEEIKNLTNLKKLVLGCGEIGEQVPDVVKMTLPNGIFKLSNECRVELRGCPLHPDCLKKLNRIRGNYKEGPTIYYHLTGKTAIKLSPRGLETIDSEEERGH